MLAQKSTDRVKDQDGVVLQEEGLNMNINKEIHTESKSNGTENSEKFSASAVTFHVNVV